ncbi:hypothetical protein RKLH11_2298 [Rhodobacteraceae bacterium KLH11]|nr:hypothetical protein RKLH11_2298 [Rhodobacteraceae bacterium KLH11]
MTIPDGHKFVEKCKICISINTCAVDISSSRVARASTG